ncbi:MAG: helix-turn-helix transcriptional regulator [Faecalibacterium sp.]|jgi:transcriptional regulator with XRE-family HTH domain|nr:helix-turn-helix transcriptional regulator [Faecalibacterium sp.]
MQGYKKEATDIFRDLLYDLVEEKKDRGISHADVAKAVGISNAMMFKYLHGTSLPCLDVLVRLANYFNVSMDYLAGRVSNRASNISDATLCDKVHLTLPVLRHIEAWYASTNCLFGWPETLEETFLNTILSTPEFFDTLQSITDYVVDATARYDETLLDEFPDIELHHFFSDIANEKIAKKQMELDGMEDSTTPQQRKRQADILLFQVQEAAKKTAQVVADTCNRKTSAQVDAYVEDYNKHGKDESNE